MAEPFVEQIYEYSKIISDIKAGIKETRRGRSIDSSDYYNDLYPRLCMSCKDFLNASYPGAKELSNDIIAFDDYKDDFMLLADYLEDRILPELSGIVSSMAEIDVETDDGYQIKSSKTGYLTIKISETGKYIHSTYDPMEEASLYIENMYNPQCSEYVFYGCGMGYYIYQLYKISDGSVKITIYEKDANLIEYAKRYGVLEWIPDENLQIVTGQDVTSRFYTHTKKDKVGYFCHFAEVDNVYEKLDKDILSDRCMEFNIQNRMKDISRLNVCRNLEQKMTEVDDINIDVGNDVFIIAAGPSLDDNLEILKKYNGKRTIIAVETVFKKLLKNDIRPDYVAVLDPSRRMIKHLKGVESETVPLIVDLGVYWRWTHDYKGDKYLVYSTYPCQEAKDYIEREAKQKWPSGGTVTFLAIEFAIRKGGKRIFLVGADFGYPDGRSHATGTAFEQIMNNYETILIDKVGGGKVRSDYSMNIFRLSVENRIKALGNEVKLYNLSSTGAHINGTYEIDTETVYHMLDD